MSRIFFVMLFVRKTFITVYFKVWEMRIIILFGFDSNVEFYPFYYVVFSIFVKLYFQRYIELQILVKIEEFHINGPFSVKLVNI